MDRVAGDNVRYPPEAPVAGERYRYGYDRNSNRKWRENVPTSGKDEYYAYDRLSRLVLMERGNLTGTYPDYTGVTVPNTERIYTLDALGNWTAVDMDFDVTLEQDRTHNSVNEITGISESTGGSSWRTSSSRMCAWITGARPPTRPLSGCTAD